MPDFEQIKQELEKFDPSFRVQARLDLGGYARFLFIKESIEAGAPAGVRITESDVVRYCLDVAFKGLEGR